MFGNTAHAKQKLLEKATLKLMGSGLKSFPVEEGVPRKHQHTTAISEKLGDRLVKRGPVAAQALYFLIPKPENVFGKVRKLLANTVAGVGRRLIAGV